MADGQVAATRSAGRTIAKIARATSVAVSRGRSGLGLASALLADLLLAVAQRDVIQELPVLCLWLS